MIFELGLLLTSIIAGGVASVAGFGIGSLVTPFLALAISAKLSIAVVAIPHLIGTALRFMMLRQHVDRRVLLSFGIMSAVGGLLGALIHTRFQAPALTLIFGVVLMFAGVMGATGLSQKIRFHGIYAWIAGGVSGSLGGLVGNQGGIRSAALLGFPISKESFIATATAVGLFVDFSRIPIYLLYQGDEILSQTRFVLLASLGVVIGTLLGTKTLKEIPEQSFRRIISTLIFFLGIFMLIKWAMSV